MPIDRFINERKNVWQRLEELLQLLDRMTLRKLHREEVRELGRIYRRTASDLAIARAESRDPRLVNYLNSLVIRAHGRIYRANGDWLGRIIRFYTHEFPQTFRRTWRYTATAFAVFIVFTAVAFFGTRHEKSDRREYDEYRKRGRGVAPRPAKGLRKFMGIEPDDPPRPITI